jgi:tetratricopeptide (TPR) repeat protein
MAKNTFAAVLGIVTVALIVAGVFLLQKANYFKAQAEQSAQIFAKAQEELSRLQLEKEQLSKEKDKSQADSLSYVTYNTKLQAERDSLRKELDDADRREKEKAEEIAKLKDSLQKLSDTAPREKKGLEVKIASLESELKKEKAACRYNLGVVYTRGKFYDEAVAEFEAALSADEGNADAQYNLGVLYEDHTHDSLKAAAHYRRYLQLVPGAEDALEVGERIKKLEAK